MAFGWLARVASTASAWGVSRFFLGDRWKRKGVIDDVDGIAVVAFEPPAEIAHPCHVHSRGEQGE